MRYVFVTLLVPLLVILPALWSQGTPSPPGTDRPHYIAVSSTLTASPSAEPLAEILLFDRDTAGLLGHVDFSEPAEIIGTSADMRSLYVYTRGSPPEIKIVDLTALAVQLAVLPLPAGTISAKVVDGAGGVERVLAGNQDQRVAIIDPATADVSWIECTAPPRAFVHNPFDKSTYAFASNRADLCVITPHFEIGPPIVTPVASGRSLDKLMVVDDGGAGTLLVTTYSGTQYVTFAIDQRGSGARILPVPSLDGVFPPLSAPPPARWLYGMSSGHLNRYKPSFADDGTVTFTPQIDSPPVVAGAPSAVDDRFVYAPVSGYCSTIEGPVICSVGFSYLDALTLQPRERNGSVVLAQLRDFGLWTTRSVLPVLSGVFPLTIPGARRRLPEVRNGPTPVR